MALKKKILDSNLHLTDLSLIANSQQKFGNSVQGGDKPRPYAYPEDDALSVGAGFIPAQSRLGNSHRVRCG